MLPSTTDRVSDQTADAVNQRIEAEYQARIAHYADHPDQIPTRLQELDHEWDIERAIEANAATLALTRVALGNA